MEEYLARDGTPEELRVLVEAALERNARDGLVLDLRGLSDATDYFVLVSGDSDVHARAIARNIQENMEEAGYEAAGVEGESQGRWILLDYFDLVVHVFLPRVRDYYQLERLWGDAPRVEFGE
ncbi:MAG: ribosome silencing factor [Gemmatimonadota bacterium]